MQSHLHSYHGSFISFYTTNWKWYKTLFSRIFPTMEIQHRSESRNKLTNASALIWQEHITQSDAGVSNNSINERASILLPTLFRNYAKAVRKCHSSGLAMTYSHRSEMWSILHGHIFACVMLSALIASLLLCSLRADELLRGIIKKRWFYSVSDIFDVIPEKTKCGVYSLRSGPLTVLYSHIAKRDSK